MRGGRRLGAGRPCHKLQTVQLPREDIRSLARFQRLHPDISTVPVGIIDVGLDWQACRFGGFRPWFLCPGCGRRCALLYLWREQPKCARCYGLTYPSQALDKFDRSWLRTRKLEARIGALDFRTRVPFKPRGMHWDTFEETIARLFREQAFRDAIFVGWGKRYFGVE